MEMIVEDSEGAGDVNVSRGNNGFVNSPQLKEVESLSLSAEQWESCYDQTLHIVQELYQKCKLVHADLSEYNLLLHNKEQVYALVSRVSKSVYPKSTQGTLRRIYIL